jgi:hypothetical protein
MPDSTLPPIGWHARCGHWNEVRSGTGGFKVNCKMCGAAIWCPKRKVGRPQTGRPVPAGASRKPAAAIAGAQPQPGSGPVQHQAPVRDAGSGNLTLREVIGQLAGASAGGKSHALADTNGRAAPPRTSCRRCGTTQDPAHPEVCPCGQADWVTQTYSRVVGR